MATVTFAGAVSAQSQIGETITITVTKPDATKDVWTTLTLADKTFSLSKTYAIGGPYSAVAHIDADAQNKAADSPAVNFQISADRTITLTVNVS